MLHMKRLGAMLAVTLLAALPAGAETGTDKTAGSLARFYMSGSSEYLIRFVR